MSSGAKAPKQKRPQAPAALKEGGGAKRTVEVRGFAFELPDEKPFGVLLAYRDIWHAAEAENAGQAEFAVLDLVEAYVGKPRLKEFTGSLVSIEEGTEALKELVDAINEEYAVDLGESSASQGS